MVQPNKMPASDLVAAEAPVHVLTIDHGRPAGRHDLVAAEEPLEIRICFGPHRHLTTIAITMRTPGQDAALAAGFLLTEGIVRTPADIEAADASGNTLTVRLRPDVPVDIPRLQRHIYVSSSCGVCGKTSLAAVQAARHFALPARTPVIPASILCGLPERLRQSQALFDRTGGLHAAALFDPAGTLTAVHEDVGRHNALDKLIGQALLEFRLPLADSLVLVSGRASFELVQKALMAGLPILAAVGAPSSLAVALARSAGMTLLGFLRGDRFNAYSGMHRLRLDPGPGEGASHEIAD